MSLVALLSGVLIAGAASVAGAAMVIVWTVAYGSGHYCLRQIHQGIRSEQPGEQEQALRQQVS